VPICHLIVPNQRIFAIPWSYFLVFFSGAIPGGGLILFYLPDTGTSITDLALD
jgi:hypothetical protein